MQQRRIRRPTPLPGGPGYHPNRDDALAIAVTRVASDSGLDGLTSIIASDIKDLKDHNVPGEKIDIYLASIWIAFTNAAMLQRVDPFPYPVSQEIIDEGMNFAGPRLNIPDVESCMLLAGQTIIKAQKDGLE